MNSIGGAVAGDVLVVGGGAAGLTVALVLAPGSAPGNGGRRPDASQRGRR